VAALTLAESLPDEALDRLFREARTPGGFTGEPVGPAELGALWELIRWGPTSFNQQPLRILELRSQEARARLARHLSGRNRAKAADVPLTLLLAADLNFHESLPRLFPNAPLLYQWLADTPDARRERGRYDAILQIGYLILAVRALGLAAMPVLGFDEDGVNAEFFPEGDHEALLVLHVGHPLPPRHPRLPRLTHDEVVTTL
jgi:3-hydroxypropanoate dehydrogenase